MTVITWEKGEVPPEIEVRQIYGISFNKYGQVLLRVEDGKYKLTGGKPEKSDSNYVETLKREFIEEVNTKISDSYMVGYQLVDDGDGTPKYAQIRMVTFIEEINEAKPDPDREVKWIYGRILVSVGSAIEKLKWGEVGRMQVSDAFEIAKEKFNIEVRDIPDRIINEEEKNK